MEEMQFVVLRLDGDYAVLRHTDTETETDIEIPLARALLPAEAAEGTRLLYADLEYTVL